MGVNYRPGTRIGTRVVNADGLLATYDAKRATSIVDFSRLGRNRQLTVADWDNRTLKTNVWPDTTVYRETLGVLAARNIRTLTGNVVPWVRTVVSERETWHPRTVLFLGAWLCKVNYSSRVSGATYCVRVLRDQDVHTFFTPRKDVVDYIRDSYMTGRIYPIDGIPAEIHLIKNPIARRAAIAAFDEADADH